MGNDIREEYKAKVHAKLTEARDLILDSADSDDEALWAIETCVAWAMRGAELMVGAIQAQAAGIAPEAWAEKVLRGSLHGVQIHPPKEGS